MVMVTPFMWRHRTTLAVTELGLFRYECPCGWESAASQPIHPSVGAVERVERERQRDAHVQRKDLFIRFEIVGYVPEKYR
jgi:hypothetical protein